MNRHQLKSSKELYNITNNYYADGSGKFYQFYCICSLYNTKKFKIW